MRRALLALPLALSTLACTDGGADTDTDPPPPITARFVADAYLQDCRWSEEDWLGVEALRVTLHHSSDGVPPVELPAPGTCVNQLELFAEEALPASDGIEGLDTAPRYISPEGEGSLRDVLPGLWHSDVFVAKDRCGTLDEAIGDGVSLDRTGPFSALSTPSNGTIPSAMVDGARFTDREPLSDGDTATFTWEAEGWDAAFVQLRREQGGELRDVVTCGASGGSFTLDDTAWDQTNSAVLADGNHVYLGLVREELVETVDGSARAWMVVRALHVLDP